MTDMTDMLDMTDHAIQRTETTANRTGYADKEVSVLTFNVGPYRLGINLGKVREIARILPFTPVPYAHPVVQGLFELRNHLIPALNLNRWLGTDDPHSRLNRIIITQFMGMRIGFLVDNVEGIMHMQWNNIEPPTRIQRFSDEVLGTIKQSDDKPLITLIDYERIVLTVNPGAIMPDSSAEKRSAGLNKQRKTKSVWIVDDSRMIRDFLKTHLKENHYVNIVFFADGNHALETLAAVKKNRRIDETDIQNRVDLIISDIEMPVMNGYQLVKALKEEPQFTKIPVILFSSLITQENKLKGQLVNADAQLSKSESANLVPLMDRLIFQG